MAKRKKKTSKGNIFARVQKTAKVRSIKNRIRKQKSALKKLSSEYKRTVKSEIRKLK